MGIHLLTWIGLGLILIGTALTYIGNQKSSSNRDSEIKTIIKEKNKEISEVFDGQKDVMDQNVKLLEQNVILHGDIKTYQEEVENKNKKIRELELNANKKYFKPLAKDIRNVIVDRLRQMKSRIDDEYKEKREIKFSFGTLDQVVTTNLVCAEIGSMLQEAGYKVEEGSLNPLVIQHLKAYKCPVLIVHPEYEEIGANIVMNFREYIPKLKFVCDSDYSESTFKFQFMGNPEFSEEGIVTYIYD